MNDTSELRARLIGCVKGSKCTRWLDDLHTTECAGPATGTVLFGVAQNHPNAEFAAPMIFPAPSCEKHLQQGAAEGYRICRDMYEGSE